MAPLGARTRTAGSPHLRGQRGPCPSPWTSPQRSQEHHHLIPSGRATGEYLERTLPSGGVLFASILWQNWSQDGDLRRGSISLDRAAQPATPPPADFPNGRGAQLPSSLDILPIRGYGGLVPGARAAHLCLGRPAQTCGADTTPVRGAGKARLWTCREGAASRPFPKLSHRGHACEKELLPCGDRHRLHHHQDRGHRPGRRPNRTFQLPAPRRSAGPEPDRLLPTAARALPRRAVPGGPHRVRGQGPGGRAGSLLRPGGSGQLHRHPQAVQRRAHRHRAGRAGRQGALLPPGRGHRPPGGLGHADERIVCRRHRGLPGRCASLWRNWTRLRHGASGCTTSRAAAAYTPRPISNPCSTRGSPRTTWPCPPSTPWPSRPSAAWPRG